MNNTIEFLTDNQVQFMKKIKLAGRQRIIIRIEAPLGTGLWHATTEVLKKSPGFKIVYIDCEESNNGRAIFVKLLREAMNVRFSNLNYQRVDIGQFGQLLRKRLQEDLKDQNLVLIFDHVNTLNKTALSALLKLIQNSTFQFGVIFRSTNEHRLKLRKKEPIIHDELYLKLTNNVLTVEENSKEEMKTFIKDVNGITEESFIMDLLKAKFGFSKCQIFINRYKNVHFKQD